MECQVKLFYDLVFYQFGDKSLKKIWVVVEVLKVDNMFQNKNSQLSVGYVVT